jgi:putative membrane protein
VHEDWKHVNVFLTEAINSERQAVSGPLRQALKGRTVEGQVALGPEAVAGPQEPAPAPSGGDEADDEESLHIVVLASGNLGLVYSTRSDERITLEEIEAEFPGLLDGLAEHEGVGFVLVRSQEQGGVVIGPAGRYYLAEDRVEGENPLAAFGPNAAEHLRRTDSFAHAPDLLVNSFCRPERNEVAAFEEQIGCHGGLGGFQTRPFVLYPAGWQLAEGELMGAEAVYRQFKRWLRELGTDSA